MADFWLAINPGSMTSDAIFTVTVTSNDNFKGTVTLTAETDNGTLVHLNDTQVFLCPNEIETVAGQISTVASPGELLITGSGEGQSASDAAELVP